MSSTAENTYLTGLRLGYGPHDDAGMVRIYYPEPLSKATSSVDDSTQSRNVGLVLRLLKGIHLAGVAEAVAFTKHLDLNFSQYAKLVTTAAGGSIMFDREGERMYRFLDGSEEKASAGGESIDNIVHSLDEAMEAASQVRCSLFLGADALSLFRFAQARGFGSSNVSNLVSLWKRGRG